MTTANALIRAALGKLGIVSPGEAVKAGDGEDCLLALNRVLDSWKMQRLYAYATQTITAALPAGIQTLTIGPGADIVTTARPDRFEVGSYCTVQGVDYPLTVVNEADFNAITLKDLRSLVPVVMTYRPSLPMGVLQFYPEAGAGATLNLLAQVQVSAFADLVTDYGLPSGYERALVYALAEEIGADYEREIPPTVARNAAMARRAIKRANSEVPQLQLGPLPESRLARFIAG